MGRGAVVSRLRSFCINRVATRILVRTAPPAETTWVDSGPVEIEMLNPKGGGDCEEVGTERNEKHGKAAAGRRVVIAVDSSKEESMGAVQWALSHTVQSNDIIVLLSVVKPKNGGGGEGKRVRDRRDVQLLSSLKNMCQAKKPEVQVEFSIIEGPDRGPAIVQEVRRQGASLLVLSLKKRTLTWRLLLVWVGRVQCKHRGMVDYCIQNAGCMTVAVRRKSKKGGGGYLITTKMHKDFWLLA